MGLFDSIPSWGSDTTVTTDPYYAPTYGDPGYGVLQNSGPTTYESWNPQTQVYEPQSFGSQPGTPVYPGYGVYADNPGGLSDVGVPMYGSDSGSDWAGGFGKLASGVGGLLKGIPGLLGAALPGLLAAGKLAADALGKKEAPLPPTYPPQPRYPADFAALPRLEGGTTQPLKLAGEVVVQSSPLEKYATLLKGLR